MRALHRDLLNVRPRRRNGLTVLAALAVPMILLYLIGVAVAYLFGKKVE